MPKNLTDVDAFTSPVAVPVGADPHTAASAEVPWQALADRTRYVKNRSDANDQGLDMLGLSNWTYQEGLSSTTTNDVRAIAYDGTTVCLVGEGGMIETSLDLRVWSAETNDGSYTGHFYGLCFGNSLFVAVGSAGEIQTSPDGSTWTSRRTGGSEVFYDVLWNGTNFVAVGQTGSAGFVMTSPDGTTWTSRTPGDTGGYRAVAFNPDHADDRIVAVGLEQSGGGGTGLVGVSYSDDDGVTWTDITWGGTDTFGAGSDDAHSLIWDTYNSRFVMSGRLRFVAVSDDGVTWSEERTADVSAQSDPGMALVQIGDVLAMFGGELITTTGNGDRGFIKLGRSGALVDAPSFAANIPFLPTDKAIVCAVDLGGIVLCGLDGGGILRGGVLGHRL